MTALLLLIGAALAQECAEPPPALGDLSSVIAMIHEETLGAEAYCPDDLGLPLDTADADARAAQMNGADRAAAAELLQEAVAGLGSDHVQAQANAAALIDALLGASLAAGDDVSAILDALLAIAEATEDPLLHRQIALNLWRQGVDDPRVAELLEIYLPSEPDYEHILPAGKTELAVTIHTGQDGFAYAEFRRAFEKAGATIEVIEEDQEWLVTYEVKPDDPTLPTLTYKIAVVSDGHRDLFDDFATDDVNIGMYADHSQLGTSQDGGLSAGPVASESTDLFWNLACKSKVFASRISQQYPKAHVVYTKDSEYFLDMPRSFERGLVALANHYDYDEMRRLVGAGSAWQPKNYIFPDDPQKLVFQDQDGDGVADAEDRIYDVASSVENLGELASKAVHIANTYVSYSGAYTMHSARLDYDAEDMYRPDGTFDGEPGGPSTRIEQRVDAFGEDKWFVAVSDELLDMHQTTRTALITHDMAEHWAGELGWDEPRSADGAFLAGAAVFDVWYGDGWEDYQAQVRPGADLDEYDVAGHLDEIGRAHV